MRLRKHVWIAFHLVTMLGIGGLFAANQYRASSLIPVSEFRVPGPVVSLALSPDASTVLVGTSGYGNMASDAARGIGPKSFSLWTRDGRRDGGTSFPYLISGFHFVSSSQILFTGERTMDLWDAASEHVTRLPGVDTSLTLSPDGRYAASYNPKSKTATVVDFKTGKVRKLAGETDANPRFTPDGMRLYAVDRTRGKLHFWERESGHRLPATYAPREDVTAADYSSNGRLLALAHNDGRISFALRNPGDRTSVPATRATRFAHFYGIQFSGAGRYLIAYGEAPVAEAGPRRAFQVFDLEKPEADDRDARAGQPMKITETGTCLVVVNRRVNPLWSRFPRNPAAPYETDRRLFDARTRTWWNGPWNSRSSGGIVNLSDDGECIVTSSGLHAPVQGIVNLRPPSQTITVYRIPRR